VGSLKPPEHIFRAYDVRGIYGKDLDDEAAYLLGRGFGTLLEGRGPVLACRDVRISGEPLIRSFTKGLLESGIDVLDAGVSTTPACYFGVRHFSAAGGVMATASHNPAEWNGFKMVLEDGSTVGEGYGMEKLRRIVAESRFRSSPTQGVLRHVDLASPYLSYLSTRFGRLDGLRVAVDYSDGAAALLVPGLFRDMGIDVVGINDNPDGMFRGHPPEPNEETLRPLQDLVVQSNSSFGVGFDGDADRAVIIDETGRLLTGDIILALLLRHWPTKGKVVYDVSSSSAVREVAMEQGFHPIEWKVGRAFLLQKVREEGAVLGGEKSNHLYFGELGGADDAVFAALTVAEIVHKAGVGLSRLVERIPRYPATPIINYNCPDEAKFKAVEAIAEKLSTREFRIMRLDGVKAYKGSGWILIRASNTMPQLKMTVEAGNETELERLRALGDLLIKETVSSLEKSRIR